jgi:hypothetical protein
LSQASKKEAQRMFIYLRSAGVTPSLRGNTYAQLRLALSEQFRALSSEQRRAGRVLGRRRIIYEGYTACLAGTTNLIPPYRPEAQRPTCPTCRVTWPDKPKAVWPTEEDAEEFCSLRGGLRAYACPDGHGYHVASLKKKGLPWVKHASPRHR